MWRPDELGTCNQGGSARLDGVPVVGVGFSCYSGSPRDEKALAPLREVWLTDCCSLFGPMSYLQMHIYIRPLGSLRPHAYWKSNFLSSLPDEAIETFSRYALTAPSPYTNGPWLETVHGAVSRIDSASTAFAHRRHPF